MNETLDTLQQLSRLEAEIEKLKQKSFRWIPVGEQMPPLDREIFVLDPGGNALLWKGFHGDTRLTHWAPIPPLPEKSQGEKDEELWAKYDDVHACDTGHKEFRIRQAFLAGLRAAREQKP